MVLISKQKSSNYNKKLDEKQVASSNHITIRDYDDSYSKIKLAETVKTLEDRGRATSDDLKELHLGTSEEPRLIYVSSLLTPKEEKEYFDSC